MNNTKQAKVYDCYLSLMTIEEVAKKLDLSYNQVQKYYTNFIVYSAKIKGDTKADKLAQLYEVEKKLFHLIETDPTNAKINNLSYIYSSFCI
ncbi:hypothetical protein UFOVP212_47 [uncultured Caudovirales phage]|uniref:Uncharacterized protein n=1 Tax=uncultured Caudovirales phage TaxID=2100421 RepID=A0A6J7WKI4_9CAUD|nr:hypothetical protein UFOVP212_47 [uncultured Caudovirales phage]